MTIYKQVPIEEELPPIRKFVIFLRDNAEQTPILGFLDEDGEVNHNGNHYTAKKKFKCWLSPITLPTEEEIRSYAIQNTNFSQEQDGFIEGAEYIINLLKAEK